MPDQAIERDGIFTEHVRLHGPGHNELVDVIARLAAGITDTSSSDVASSQAHAVNPSPCRVAWRSRRQKGPAHRQHSELPARRRTSVRSPMSRRANGTGSTSRLRHEIIEAVEAVGSIAAATLPLISGAALAGARAAGRKSCERRRRVRKCLQDFRSSRGLRPRSLRSRPIAGRLAGARAAGRRSCERRRRVRKCLQDFRQHEGDRVSAKETLARTLDLRPSCDSTEFERDLQAAFGKVPGSDAPAV